ncbi:hypothetical protein DFH08DRAFT_977971 [Mycena albidolilacea]|uniref:Uncharacterized protein n=1 Tax=Mycena albidolilacea TaxID=1033008 RepID=A0AAD6Z044_9AGAR|nr:hypothetical protein DFH08DRAFT_977971 [Mycena albidolilacea]
MSSESRATRLKAPLVDSSNRTPLVTKAKRHTHLRAFNTSSLRKCPPTCTVSLAGVTTSPVVSFSFPTTDPPSSTPPTGAMAPPACKHLPCRDVAPRLSAQVACDANPQTHASDSCYPHPPPPPTSASPPPSRAASQILADDPDSSLSLSDLEQQDLLRCERLQALLAVKGRRVPRVSDTDGYRAAGVRAVGAAEQECVRRALDEHDLSPLSTPPSAPSLTPASASAPALEMPVLVATLLLRRHEGGRQTGARTRTPFVWRASKLAFSQN